MALEIEHKFLVKDNSWQEHIKQSMEYKQGYLISDNKKSVRIRTTKNNAWLNIKSATIGTQRHEYEYEIPITDALEILNNLCEKPLIEKTRHLVPYKQHTWEIDVFKGENDGLIVAEIELDKIGEQFHIPSWIGVEVTQEIKYYNNMLCKNPYKNWKEKEKGNGS